MVAQTITNDQVRRFMSLFAGNERGHGCGMKCTPEMGEKGKLRYPKGSLIWVPQKATEVEYFRHLNGEVALGIGPIFAGEGGEWLTCRGEIDLDVYDDLNEIEEIRRVKGFGLPLVIARTKSGGLRMTLFVKELVETGLMIAVMKSWVDRLGYGGPTRHVDIFPRQERLTENGNPSWTFLPYGPTFGVFKEQCGLNRSGGSLTLDQFMDECEKTAISKDDFMGWVDGVSAGSNSSSGNQTKKGKGTGWTDPPDPSIANIEAIFKDGPICLHQYSKNYIRSGEQNDILFDAITFLMKKYPDHWEQAIRWLNTAWLKPAGDPHKLEDAIKRHKQVSYTMRCNSAHLGAKCNQWACPKMPYGVGSSERPFWRNLEIEALNTTRRQFIVILEGLNVTFEAADLINVRRFVVKWLEAGGDFISASAIKQKDWEADIGPKIDNAVVIEPPDDLKKGVYEIEYLRGYAKFHITKDVHHFGDVYRKGNEGVSVRVKAKERRVYIKGEHFFIWCDSARALRGPDQGNLREWLRRNADYYSRKDGRGWFRCTYGIGFDKFGDGLVDEWLEDKKEEVEKEEEE